MRKAYLILAILLLAFGVFAVYLQTANFGLINCDDYEYLVRSKAITGGVSKAGWDWAWGGASLEHAIWMPLTWLSYMLDFTLFGRDCWGAMHLTSVLLHTVNAILVFGLLCLLVRDGSPGVRSIPIWAFIGAAIWALHPLRVESVAWLASRKDVLSFTFELLAMICWVRSLKHRSDTPQFCAWYALSILCFLLGAFAKPSVMTFPILQACLDVFVLKRVRPKMYIAPTAMMVLIAAEAAYAQSVGGATGDMGQIPLVWRLLNAMSAYGIYLTNSVFPKALAPQCMSRFPELPRGVLIGITLSLTAASYAAYRLFRLWVTRKEMFVRSGSDPMGEWKVAGEKCWFLAGLLWFSLGIGPMLGIANFGYHAYCDRFTYIPAVGLSIALIPVLGRLRGLGGLLGLSAGIVLMCAAARQTGFWRGEKPLWEQTLAVDGDRNAVAHIGLGIAAFELDHDLEECCRELQLVREINEGPYWNCVQIHIYALCELGRIEEAKVALEWYRRAHNLYAESHKRIEVTQMGPIEVPARLTNFTDAEIAVAICEEKHRPWAEREMVKRYESSKMTPSLAYLLYRFATVTNNDKLKEHALEELVNCDKTDFLQFRYLTSKENKE